MIPLFVDCSGRRIVIFGGGEVAARKAAYFSGKADVTVVSRSFVPAFDGIDVKRQELELGMVTGRQLAPLLSGAFLVIAAISDPAINNRIGKACKAIGILFNNADGEPGDVILPAVTDGENYTALDRMIELQARLREALREREPDQARRTAILWDVLEDHTVWEALLDDPDQAWDDVRRRYLHV